MLPDLADCVELLGGPRGVRYVAQENLVEIPKKEDRSISHDLLARAAPPCSPSQVVPL